jgi:CHAD domain-containing protein
MAQSVDEGYRVLAAKYFRKQAKRLAEQAEGARKGDDPECIHQARVASRRLRAGMRMFGECFDTEQLKTWRKQIRRVTRRLGDARDKDVQIEFLCGVLDALKQKACYPGIAQLLAKLERQRQRLQPQVVEAAERLKASGVIEQMQAVTKRVLSEATAEGASLCSPCVLTQTRQHILENLEQLLAYQDSLTDPEDLQRHHALRIAAKRLRYTLEISAPVYRGRLDGTVDAIKKVQTLLGGVHDCDVWAEHLQAFAAKERQRTLKYYGRVEPFARLDVGIEYLQQQRRQRRAEVFQELVDVRGPGPHVTAPEPPLEAASQATAQPEDGRSKPNGGGAGENLPQEPRSGAKHLRGARRQAEAVAVPATQPARGR